MEACLAQATASEVVAGYSIAELFSPVSFRSGVATLQETVHRPIAEVDDEIRGIVTRNWPHLVFNLPPEEPLRRVIVAHPYADHRRLVAINFVAGTWNCSAPFLRASLSSVASMSHIQISLWAARWMIHVDGGAGRGSWEGRFAIPAVSASRRDCATDRALRATSTARQ
jgi:hypothetical protein